MAFSSPVRGYHATLSSLARDCACGGLTEEDVCEFGVFMAEFLGGEAVKFVGKYNPFVKFTNAVVW